MLPSKRLAELDCALSHFLTFNRFRVSILRSIVGVANWVCLLRRPLFSIFHAVYDVLQCYEDNCYVLLSRAVKEELLAFKRLLPLAYADTYRTVSPIVVASDAEGESNAGKGGWGLGYSQPPLSEVIELAMKSLSKGLPAVPADTFGEPPWAGKGVLTDLDVPQNWTNGEVRWTELLSGRHSFVEHINIYESRVLCRVLQLLSRIPELRRSRVVALEDNACTHYNFRRGRSPKWVLNNICRKKAGLELVSDIELLSSWVNTKRQPMDECSRGGSIHTR